MNDDMREILTKAMPESEPPELFSSEALVAAGRRKRKRRTVGAVSGGVAVVAVLAVAVPVAAGQLGSGASAASGGPLPQLDSSRVYHWEFPDESKPTNASEKYGEAFWDWLDENKPGYEYTSDERLADEGKGAEDPPTFHRDEAPLFVATDSQNPNSDTETTDYKRVVYDLADPTAVDSTGTEATAGPPLVRMPGADGSDLLDVTVHPQGRFTQGTKGPLPNAEAKGDEHFFDLVNCEGGKAEPRLTVETYTFDVECDETRSPDGQRVVEVTETATTQNGKTHSKAHAVALYRADGSAIVLRDSVPEPPSDGKNVDGMKPALTFDELTDLATSLPGDAVK